MNVDEFTQGLKDAFEDGVERGEVGWLDFNDQENPVLKLSDIGDIREKYLTNDTGFWVKLSNGEEFCVTVQKR